MTREELRTHCQDQIAKYGEDAEVVLWTIREREPKGDRMRLVAGAPLGWFMRTEVMPFGMLQVWGAYGAAGILTWLDKLSSTPLPIGKS